MTAHDNGASNEFHDSVSTTFNGAMVQGASIHESSDSSGDSSVDQAVQPSEGARGGAGVTSRLRWFDEARLFRIAVIVAASPILVSAIHNGFNGWYPTKDTALTAVYVNDVFSAHTPLVGLPTRYARGSADPFFLLGAHIFYLLAIPVRLLGVSWGLLLGMGVLNTAWFAMALWLIRRRVGYRAALLGCVVGASLLWGLGSQNLIDPTPVQNGAIAFFAFCAAAWSVTDTDPKGLIPLALSANFLFLTHPKYLIVVPLVTASALGIHMWRLARRRPIDPMEPLRRRSTHRRSLIGAGFITVLAWLPVIYQQLTAPQGNVTNWLHAQGSAPTGRQHAPLRAIGVVTSTVTTWPLWFRDSLANPNFSPRGPTVGFVAGFIGIAIVVGLMAVAARNGWRRRDAIVVGGLLVGTLAWCGWLIAVLVQPARNYNPTYLRSLWPLSAFIWLTLAFALIRSGWMQRTWPALTHSRRVPVGALGITAAFAIVTFPTASFHPGTPQSTIPIAKQVRTIIDARVPEGGPILVTSEHYPARNYLPVAVLALQERNIAVRVKSGWDSTVYGQFRTYIPTHPNAARQLVLTNSAIPPKNTRLIGFASSHPIIWTASLRRTNRQINRWAATDPTFDIPADAPFTPKERAVAQWLIDSTKALSKKRHRTFFDDPSMVDYLARPSSRRLRDIVRPPSMDDRTFRRWLDARADLTYIYYGPIAP